MMSDSDSDSESGSGIEEIASGIAQPLQHGGHHQQQYLHHQQQQYHSYQNQNFTGGLPVNLGIYTLSQHQLKPNSLGTQYYQQIVEAAQTLAPFGLDQLRALQEELKNIGFHADQALYQLEKDKNEIDRWLKQANDQDSPSDMPLSSFASSFGANPMNSMSPVSNMPVAVGSGANSLPAIKIEDRHQRIRTATPQMKEFLDQTKKRKTESDHEGFESKRKYTQDDISSPGLDTREESRSRTDLVFQDETEDNLAISLEDRKGSRDKKKRKNEIKKKKGSKSTGSKSVSLPFSNRGLSQNDSSNNAGGGAGQDDKDSVIHASNSTAVIEEEDNAKSKVGNQVPFETFYKFVEPFVRPLTDEDLNEIETTDDDPYPYMIPKLGKSTQDRWARDNMGMLDPYSDNPLGSGYGLTSGGVNNFGNFNSYGYGGLNNPASLQGPDSPIDLIGVSKPEEIWCKTVTQRILSSLIDEHVIVDTDMASMEEDDNGNTNSVTVNGSSHNTRSEGWRFSNPAPIEYERLEDRIREELKYFGLLDDEPEIPENEKEDDEICFQLRYLQESLKKQVAINNARKAKLYEKAKAYLAFQEYEQLVSDVHKQLEKIYLNRMKPGKKGKKKDKPKPITEQSVKLLRDSDRLLKKLARVFPRENYLPPKESIYEGNEAEDNPNPFPFLESIQYAGFPPQTEPRFPSILSSKKKHQQQASATKGNLFVTNSSPPPP